MYSTTFLLLELWECLAFVSQNSSVEAFKLFHNSIKSYPCYKHFLQHCLTFSTLSLTTYVPLLSRPESKVDVDLPIERGLGHYLSYHVRRKGHKNSLGLSEVKTEVYLPGPSRYWTKGISSSSSALLSDRRARALSPMVSFCWTCTSSSG